MKRKSRLILICGLIFLGLVFAFVPFHLAWSGITINSEGHKTSIGEGLPFAMRGRADLLVSFEGDPRLAKAIQDRLLANLRDSGQFNSIELLPEPVEQADLPYLLVRVSEKKVFWTPFFARSELIVETAFGSNGSVAHMRDVTIYYSNEEGPGLHTKDTYRVSDNSFGLFSYPGYHTILAQDLSAKIAEATLSLFQG